MTSKEREEIAKGVYTAIMEVMNAALEITRKNREVNPQSLVLATMRQLVLGVGEPLGVKTTKVEIAAKTADGTEVSFDLMEKQGD